MKGCRARREKNMQQQKEKGGGGGGDRISELPREILASIVCRLTLREATATSVLSSRWRNLYTYYPRLCYLPSFHPYDTYSYVGRDREKKLRNYMNILNHMLDSYKGGTNLKEFRLRMPCLDRAKANLERWFEFALAREVEIFSVDMVYVGYASCGSYTLPISTAPRRRLLMPALKTLKKLSLSGLCMHDRDVPFLLSSFVALESLSIANCGKGLKNVKIAGVAAQTELKLKQLDISHSWYVQYVEVRHVATLVSLTCCQVPYLDVLRLDDVPNLTDLTTTRGHYHVTGVLHNMQPSIIHQLLRLKLSTRSHFIYQLTFRSTNIRHLELEFEMPKGVVAPLYRLFPLLKACPLLEKLNMKFSWDRFSAKLKHERISDDIKCSWTEKHPPPPNHPVLKQVTLSGYLGSQPELGFAKHVVKNAPVLQELVVEPCQLNGGQIQRDATARVHRHFPPITPASVNLIILSDPIN